MSDLASFLEKAFDRILEVFPIVKILLLIVLLCFTALFDPWGAIEKIGIAEIVKSYRPWLVVSALVSGGFLAIHISFAAFHWGSTKLSKQVALRAISKKQLSEDAKLLLCVLSAYRPDPVNFDSSAPAVRELRDSNLVVRNSYDNGYYAKFGLSESGRVRADQSDVHSFAELINKSREDLIPIYSRASGLRASDLWIRVSQNKDCYDGQ